MLRRADHAQDFLVPFMKGTERLLRSALRSIDSQADAQITLAADLCIPHDVIRIAGGFATGCLVQWNCEVPIVPVDTTVNIDTSSVFILDMDIDEMFNKERFAELRRFVESDTSYEWNFDKGNHFISLCRRHSDGAPVLILHSNEKEFKYQGNGLMPVPGNWFYNDIQRFEGENRYLRLLVGDKAVLFSKIAKMLEDFNTIRHKFIATLICDRGARIIDEEHSHHYFMPDSQSVALGCYVCAPGDRVPVFSRPGLPISEFVIHHNDVSKCEIGGQIRHVIPHGWGKTSTSPIDLRLSDAHLELNGFKFEIQPKVSLGKHPGLVLREFDPNPESADSFTNQVKDACTITLSDRYDQVAYYTKDGVQRINNQPE